jgi:signal transduction histidine kinase
LAILFCCSAIFSQSRESIDSINALGYTYVSNNLQKCKSLYEKNINDSKKVSYQNGEAFSRRNLSLVYSLLGDYEASVSENLLALKIFEKQKKYAEIATTYADIGYRLRYINYNLAVNYFRQGIEIAKKHKLEANLASIYNNYGETIKDQDRDSALYFFKMSLKISQKYNNQVSIPFSLNKIAESYAKNKEFSKAFYYLEQSDKIRFNTTDSVGISDNIAYKADIFYEIPIVDSAIYYYEKSLQIAKRTNYNSLERFCLERLSDLYKRQGNYKKAYESFLEFNSLEDSVLNLNVKNNMANLEVKYDVEKTKRVLAENEIKLESRKKWLLLSFILLSIIVLISIFTYRYQKIKRINALKEAELNKALKTAEIEKQFVEEKLRIGRELHDNIGSHLTFMISSLDNLSYFDDPNQRIEKISDLSNFGRLTMKDLRDTIWAMNHEGGTFEHLIARISELRSVLPSNLSVFINSDVSNQRELNGIQLLNCYRIVQEFIQNTIKYADASEIKISLKDKQNDFEICLSDNGKGFDLQEISYGNGILNMKRRCEDLSGNFEINSSGEGTEIICKIPF